MQSDTICISERFRGPPTSGNGGYVTGIIAGIHTQQRFDLPAQGAAEVTLRAPVPLARPLDVSREGALLRVHDGQRLVAESVLASLALDVPEPATWDEALAAQPASPALTQGFHPMLHEQRLGFHPICFCCGAELGPSEGLHVYASPIAGRAQVAAAWHCDPAFASAAGLLPPEIICTALDCPGQYAWLAEGVRTGMLGRLTVRIEAPVRADERNVIIGWTLGSEGRRFHAGTALFNARGELCAYARAVWIGAKPSA